jgi:hypothetical protein
MEGFNSRDLSTKQFDGRLSKRNKKEVSHLVARCRNEPGGMNSLEFEQSYFELLAWAKFRHVIVRRIFDLDIKNDHYDLFIARFLIKFDYESAMHILARHFAQGMKPYPSSKDHFYGVFEHSKLHLHFEEIFSAIDEAGLFRNYAIRSIIFRYEVELYRMYINAIKNSTDYRIATFFPLSSPSGRAKLARESNEIRLRPGLNIFVRNTEAVNQ